MRADGNPAPGHRGQDLADRLFAGASISDRIGMAIAETWQKYLDEQENRPQRAGLVKARLLGLAQALAILRLAPNTPTTAQIKAIAEEFRP